MHIALKFNSKAFFENLVIKMFTISSFLPAIWISLLYFFWTTAGWSLGHMPWPSHDDPKGINFFLSDFLYRTVGIGIFAMILAVSYLLVLIQILIDPFEIMYWYLD